MQISGVKLNCIPDEDYEPTEMHGSKCCKLFVWQVEVGSVRVTTFVYFFRLQIII